jgi:uncharacterized protein YndB with AHSA1/START domain
MKCQISATNLHSYVGTDRRVAGNRPKPEDYFVVARFRKDTEPDRLVITEITPDMIIKFLAVMPTSVTDYVCDAATAQAERTRAKKGLSADA